MSHAGLPTIDPSHRPVRRGGELRSVGAKRERWIAWEDVRRAEIGIGPMTHSLHLELRDNRKAKFLWMGFDGTPDYFEATLPALLSDRFVASPGRN